MANQYYRPHALATLLLISICFFTSCKDRTPAATISAAQVRDNIAAMDRLIDAKQFENATLVARALASQAPQDPLASEALARALLSQCNANPTVELKKETALAYATAAAQRPTSPGLQSAAGMAAYGAGNIEEAIRLHQKARQLEPGNPQHLYMEAMMWNASAKPITAIELLQMALKLQPDSAEIEMGLAEALAQHGEEQPSIQHMQRARGLADHDSTIRFRSAALLRSVGQPSEAAEMLLGAVSIGSADRATCELCANCLTDAGKHAQSAEVWEQLAAMTLMQPLPLLEAARSWSRAGQDETALIFLEKARQANPPQAYFELVREEILARRPRQP